MNPTGAGPPAAEWLDQLLSSDALPRTPPHDCAYLENRQARSQGFRTDTMPAGMYRLLLDRNFRRSGRVFYRAACDACRSCQQLRVPVRSFVRSRSQERVWRMNVDVQVAIDEPQPTEEKHELYRRYLAVRHTQRMSDDWADFASFLYESPTTTVEITYRLGCRLLAVSLADVVPEGLSSVYVYFDPDYPRRSAGIYSALWEIDYCLRTSRSYYYLGYYVSGSKTMEYKARFRPHEVLIDGVYRLPVPPAE